MHSIIEKARTAGASVDEIKLIEAHCVRCVHVQPSQFASASRSHFGGVPLVTEDFHWPFSSGARTKLKARYPEDQYLAGPLTFVAQIDLAEVSALSERVLALPADGLLLFFAAPHKVDHPHTGSVGPDWLVHYISNGSLLAPASPPVLPAQFSENIVNQERFILPNQELKMSLGWSVNPIVRYELPHLCSLFAANAPQHILGGFPNTLQSPIEGCGDYLPPEGAEALPSQMRAAAIRKDKDWIQLLQIDSDDSFRFSWLYGGRGHFMIRPHHLAAMSFDKAVLVTQVT